MKKFKKVLKNGGMKRQAEVEVAKGGVEISRNLFLCRVLSEDDKKSCLYLGVFL